MRPRFSFEHLGRTAYRRRRLVLALAILFMIFAGAWGTGVFSKLISGNAFAPPNSQSQQESDQSAAASRQVRDQIGADTPLPVAVGGVAADSLVELLSPGGTLVYYSNASGTPVDTQGELATRKNVTVTKLFVGAFDRQTRLVPFIEEAAALIAAGEINVPVEAVYPLDQIDEAIRHLYRGGKILLRVDPTAR